MAGEDHKEWALKALNRQHIWYLISSEPLVFGGSLTVARVVASGGGQPGSGRRENASHFSGSEKLALKRIIRGSSQ